MYKSIDQYDFVDAFETMNRSNNFTVEARRALFEYLEEYEESTGERVELDVIALCCDYTEYENIEQIEMAYSKGIRTIEDLEYYTTVIQIPTTDRLLIANF